MGALDRHDCSDIVIAKERTTCPWCDEFVEKGNPMRRWDFEPKWLHVKCFDKRASWEDTLHDLFAET